MIVLPKILDIDTLTFYLKFKLIDYQNLVYQIFYMVNQNYHQTFDKPSFCYKTDLIYWLLKEQENYDEIQGCIILYFLKFYCNNQYIVNQLLQHTLFKQNYDNNSI